MNSTLSIRLPLLGRWTTEMLRRGGAADADPVAKAGVVNDGRNAAVTPMGAAGW